MQSERENQDCEGWVQNFEALTWAAVASIYVAFLWKLSDFVAQKEKRRRLLTTGQI
jgi:hypothetical protein